MDKCAKCNKAVYPTERVMAIKKPWHKACFKCNSCGVVLALGKEEPGKDGFPYCKKCHQVQSGVSGYGFGNSLDSHTYRTDVHPKDAAAPASGKFCPQCGTQAKIDAAFCASCGNRFS